MSEIRKRDYQFFAEYIFDNSGIYYGPDDYYRLDSRIKTLCEHFNVQNSQELFDLFQLKITTEMHKMLIDTATNNETYFFRDNKPFDAIVKVVKETIEEKGFCNIWSLGCSTGQEPYSILLSLMENQVDLTKVKIRASDISEAALSKAKAGEYNMIEIQRGLPTMMMVKYFTQNDRVWKIKDEIRRQVSFDQFNIIKDNFPYSQFDLVLCRNVIIYQTVENKKVILKSIFQALRSGAYLALGSGESLIGMNINSQVVKILNAHFYQKEGAEAKQSA